MEPLRIDQAAVSFALHERSLMNHGAPVACLTISPDGTTIASAGADGSLKIWDRYRRVLLAEIQAGLVTPDGVAISSDKKTILTGVRDNDLSGRGLVMKNDVSTGSEISRFYLHDGAITGLALAPSGNRGATIGVDRMVRIWDSATGAVILSGNHPDWGLGVAFTQDGSLAVSVSQDWTLHLWDSTILACVGTWHGEAGPYQAVLSPGAEWMAAKRLGREAHLIEVMTGRCIANWDTLGRIGAVYACGAGSVAVWEIWANSLKAWHVQSSRYLQVAEGDIKEIRCMAVSQDGMLVAAGGNDGQIGIWEAV